MDETLATLLDLGLTSCEARVWMALLHCGMSTAKTVSRVSKVTRQDVYRVIPKLEKKGLVSKTLTFPAMFIATPVEDGVSILLKKRRNKTIELETSAKTLIRNLAEGNQITLKEEKNPEFILVPGKEALWDKIGNSIENVQGTIDTVSSYKRYAQAFSIFSETLKEAWSRGVKCRFIMNRPEKSKAAEKIFKFFTKSDCCRVRFIPYAPKTVMTIYDQKEIFIILNPNARMSESPALWSNNSSLIAGMQDYFTILWITALEKPEYNINGEQT